MSFKAPLCISTVSKHGCRHLVLLFLRNEKLKQWGELHKLNTIDAQKNKQHPSQNSSPLKERVMPRSDYKIFLSVKMFTVSDQAIKES